MLAQATKSHASGIPYPQYAKLSGMDG